MRRSTEVPAPSVHILSLPLVYRTPTDTTMMHVLLFKVQKIVTIGSSALLPRRPPEEDIDKSGY